MTSRRIRILCADDHPMIRDGIAYAIQTQKDMELVAEVSNGQEALEAYRLHRPDVTLMDLQMPQMNGIEATRAIREEFPDAKILILTTYSGDVRAAEAFRHGATGFVLKGMLRTELVTTIRSVFAGHKTMPTLVASQMAKHYEADALSAREKEVLSLVAEGCANKIVADKLDISEDTVKAHMKNILAKLDANDRTHAVVVARQRGFLDL